MRNFPFLLFALALFVSCTEEEPSAAEFIDLTVILDVTNSKGQNVFDPTSENFIDPNGIRLYYKENDNYKLYYQENRDAPYGFDISTIEEPSWMSLWAEELINTNEVSEYMIKWNNEDSDTLNFEVDVQNNGGYVSITKVWYNGNLAWDVATDNEIRLIKVVKD